MQGNEIEGLRKNIVAYPAWTKENPRYYMADFIKLSLPFMSEENLAGMSLLKSRYDKLFAKLCSSNSKNDIIDEIMETLTSALELFNASYDEIVMTLNKKDEPVW